MDHRPGHGRVLRCVVALGDVEHHAGDLAGPLGGLGVKLPRHLALLGAHVVPGVGHKGVREVGLRGER